MMENTEVHYEMTVSSEMDEWNEKITGLKTRNEVIGAPETDPEAIATAQKIIAFFNATLRPGEAKRVLRCVQRVETKVIDIMEYTWP